MEKIKVEELKEKFPKSIKALGEFIFPVLGVLDSDFPDEETRKNITDKITDVVLSNTPRLLLDFFDKYKLFISIVNQGDEQSWECSVSGTEFVYNSTSRAEADQKAYYNAFKALEEQL